MTELTRRYVRISRGQVHTAEIGEGPLILFVHGNPWDGRFWDSVLPVFAKAGYRALAFDAIGYGRSDRAHEALSIEDQAQDLAELIGAIGSVPAALVGWHQGAVVATALAVAEPALCPAIVFDGGGTHSAEAAEAMIRLVIAHRARTPKWEDLPRWWMETIVGRLTLFNPNVLPDEANWPVVERMLFGMLCADPALTAQGSPMVPPGAREVKGGTPWHDWLASLGRLTAPALILTAEDEPLRPAYEAACAAAPHADQWEFPGGHPLIGIGREAEYAAPILDFLAARRRA